MKTRRNTTVKKCHLCIYLQLFRLNVTVGTPFESRCEENEKRRENLEMCGEHRPPSMRFALEVFWFLGRMFFLFPFLILFLAGLESGSDGL